MNKHQAVVIILARAGSKGLPGKNSAMLAGKPCVQWTIEAAKEAGSVGMIVVSSDDADVNACAHELGCTVVDRPAELAHDTATIDDAARHAYEQIGSPDVPIVILYANVPIRPVGLIDDAVAMLVESGCDSVQSYAAVGKHHPWWTVRVDEDGSVSPWEGEVLYHGCFRRQDLPSAHVPDGGVIALTSDALMRRVNAPDGPHCFLGNDRRGIVNDEGDVIDIDSRVDQVVAGVVLGEKRGLATEHTEGAEKSRRRWDQKKKERMEEEGEERGIMKEEMEEREGEKREKDGGKRWDGLEAQLTHAIIGCAMRVHQELGPGLLESVYELCLIDELGREGIAVENQVVCDVAYQDRLIPAGFRMDLVVENKVVVEIKAVDVVKMVHRAQLMSYLKITGHRVGLLLNFNERMLKDGIKRIVL